MNNRNFPKYVYEFLYKKTIPGFITIISLGILVLTLDLSLGIIYKKDAFICITSITIIYFVVTLILVILFLQYSVKYTNKYTFDKSLLLASYVILNDINNNELEKYIKDDIFLPLGKNIKDLDIIFEAYTHEGFIDLGITFSDKDKSKYIELNNELLSYIKKYDYRILNKKTFNLFINYKYYFLKYLFKYNDTIKIEMKLKK